MGTVALWRAGMSLLYMVCFIYSPSQTEVPTRPLPDPLVIICQGASGTDSFLYQPDENNTVNLMKKTLKKTT